MLSFTLSKLMNTPTIKPKKLRCPNAPRKNNIYEDDIESSPEINSPTLLFQESPEISSPEITLHQPVFSTPELEEMYVEFNKNICKFKDCVNFIQTTGTLQLCEEHYNLIMEQMYNSTFLINKYSKNNVSKNEFEKDFEKYISKKRKNEELNNEKMKISKIIDKN